ncbi:MAG TPA: hypothetical protein PKD70_00065 [Saprospiraceae bacterium]|nr:hypothetical protein [Saprospiraceae bacterium]
MSQREDILRELDNLSPTLSKLKRQLPNAEAPPESYFDALPGQIWQQLKLQPAAASAVPARAPWWQSLWQPRPVWLGAAPLLLAFVAGWFLLRPAPAAPDLLAALSEEEITGYIAAYIQEFDTDLLVRATVELPDASALHVEDTDLEEFWQEIIHSLDEKTLEAWLNEG